MIKVTHIDHMGSDLSVVNAARVSFGKESLWNWSKELDSDTGDGRTLRERDTKLIKYLAEHKHMSPFGHAFASFHIKAPIFVARQLVKHSYLRWNEVSRRYVDSDPEFYEPEHWRDKSEDKKQGSGGKSQSQYFPNIYIKEVAEKALGDYKKMLTQGIAPEQARMVLPQNTMTEWYWSGSLDAFANMCRLRCKEDTQAETQEVAWAISLKMEDLFPVSWVALRDE